MIAGLAGYHSSGKSVLAEFLAKEFGWQWIVKRELLKNWSGSGDDECVWTDWYRSLYDKMGSYEIMHHLLRRVGYTKNDRGVAVLDSIHTPDEWRAVKEVDPNAILAGVFIPKECRLQRSSPQDLVLDIKRERYWHTGNSQSCLLAEVEWSFSGMANSDLRQLEAKAFFEHLTASGKINRVLFDP